MATELIGWASGILLIATIGSQLVRQQRAHSVRGVSPLLFVGQLTASAGLGVYSYLQRDWVFVTINAVMAMAAAAGFVMWWRLRRTG